MPGAGRGGGEAAQLHPLLPGEAPLCLLFSRLASEQKCGSAWALLRRERGPQVANFRQKQEAQGTQKPRRVPALSEEGPLCSSQIQGPLAFIS